VTQWQEYEMIAAVTQSVIGHQGPFDHTEAAAVALTNAAGGIRPDYEVGQPVLISDHINLTGSLRSPARRRTGIRAGLPT